MRYRVLLCHKLYDIILSRTQVSTLFCLLLVVAAFAQASNGHMKYMGIPITGTIAQFQAKLAAKGVKYNQQLSGMLEAGTRSFNGTFAGNKVTIFV